MQRVQQHGIKKGMRPDTACRPLAFCLGLVLTAATLRAQSPVRSEWVHPDQHGKLLYKQTPRRDRIMDFSHAGYMGGGVPLPRVPLRKTIKPSGTDDDSAPIQAAIDEVSALPLDKGIRGAVLLEPGAYHCPRTITLSASGVVLRGSGTTSVVKLTGRPHLAIAVRAPGARGGASGANDTDLARTTIADDYVPAGAPSFNVADPAPFAVGDTISIRKPVTQAWVEFMAMHDLVRDGQPQTWIRTGDTRNHERKIAGLYGKTITLDVPLPDSFDAKLLTPPGTMVHKIRPPQRLSQCGVENLRIESPPQEINHTQPHFTALRITGEDCWARDLVIDETMNSVSVGGRRITLQRVTINRNAKHQGSSKPAEFAPNGTQVLLDRCAVNADNVWFVATGAGVSGPVVILNCTFTGTGRAESHQRWSTGMLYDNVNAPDGGIEFRNRGAMGSGHGWSMGWGVAWNCTAKEFVIQNPPGALNWMIGCTGENAPKPRPFNQAPMLAGGVEDSRGKRVTPQSLYLAQLKERLGAGALRAIGYPTE